jgi:hypothetical protein
MDPNETWKNLLLALREGKAYESHDAALKLSAWIRKGGFCPTGLWRAILESEISE